MNRYATAGIVLLLVNTVGLQAQAQDKAHSAKKPSIERRLQILEDKEEIRELLVAYGRDFDKRDFTAYAQLFASDGVWTGGSPGHMHTPAAMPSASSSPRPTRPAPIRAPTHHVQPERADHR